MVDIQFGGGLVEILGGENTAEAEHQADRAETAAGAASALATAAAGSASTATTKAGEAAASATAAAGSATAAGGSASAASTSATAAANSATTAAAAVAAVADATFDTFALAAAATHGANIKSILTLGYSAAGDLGGTIYVDDALTDAALTAAHPLVCFSTNGGTRHWRPLGVNGTIMVEAAGAAGDPNLTYAVNDQPKIQAAITYANAVGLRTVGFGKAAYTIWHPTRTTDPADGYATDGCGMVLTKTTRLVGMSGKGMTRIYSRNNNGGDLGGTTPGTNFQIVAGKVWRGHGIFVARPATDPGIYERPGVEMENISLQGGTLATSLYTYPASTVNGDGWDITHKGIYVCADGFTGTTIVKNSEVVGFRGELIYSSNNQVSGALYMDNVLLAESNGQSFNPAGGYVYATNVRSYNTVACFEGWGGVTGYIQGWFYNILSNASSIQGGVYNTSGSGSYYKPQIPASGPFAGQRPTLFLDITVQSAGKQVLIGSWLHGRITAIDTVLQANVSTFPEGIINTNLEIKTIVDKQGLSSALSLTPSATAGSQLIRNCRYDVTVEYTDRAQTAGYVLTDRILVLGGTSFGPDVTLTGRGRSNRSDGMSGTKAALQDNGVRWKNCELSPRASIDTGVSGQNVSTSATLVLMGSWMGISGTGNTQVDVILPTTGIPDGAELNLENVTGSNSGFTFTLGVAGSSGFIGGKRVIGPRSGDHRVQLIFDKVAGGWRALTPQHPLTAVATIDIPSIAAGAVSAVQTVTCYGARVGMVATVNGFSDLGDNAAIVDVRPVTDAVKFRILNRDAAAYDPPNLNYYVTAQYARG